MQTHLSQIQGPEGLQVADGTSPTDEWGPAAQCVAQRTSIRLGGWAHLLQAQKLSLDMGTSLLATAQAMVYAATLRNSLSAVGSGQHACEPVCERAVVSVA